MATNEIHIAASPERVFEVLSNPRSYGHWVVGSDRIRAFDVGWPAPGTRFHHRVGVGPLTIDDHTEVLASSPPRRLVLRARARPAGAATVEMRLSPEAGGTRVKMIERPALPVLGRLLDLYSYPLVWLRNVVSLRRLRDLAESPEPV
jgi:uncharacterized protein YndB with AHSA1/START domain